MFKRIAVLAVILLVGLGTAAGQSDDTAPTIIHFAVDMDTLTVDSLTVSAAESGEAAVTLSWYAVALTETHYLELQTYVLDAWQTLLPDPDGAAPEPLPVAGEQEVPVRHPADFGLPAYRLVIKEEGYGVVDAHVLTLPYAESAELEPAIAVFTADEASFDPAALARGEARVNVVWEIADRPPDANLMFEQVLGSGVAVSVEQPRAHLWVPSVGEGAVTLSPADEEIRLRLRLVDMSDGVLLDEKEVAFAVDAASTLRIRSFSALVQSVDAAALRAGEARVSVTWEVLNRPETANLVFEQVLESGRAVSVELPRDDPMVPSNGRGEVAPAMPEDETADSITLRLRVVDMNSGHTLDQRTLTLPVARPTGEPPAVAPTPPAVAGRPAIVSCLTDAASLEAEALREGSARAVVSWRVDGRPETANLVFEQVLPGGIVYSVELPRDDPMVPSAGRGEVAPTYAPDDVVLRLRLVDMESETLLDERLLRIPVEEEAPAPGAPEIVVFAAEPDEVARGGNVTLSWEVRGAERVALWKLNPNGQYAGWLEDQPAVGSWTGEIPELYMNEAPFQLYAEGAGGERAYANLKVEIACPYAYFFTPPQTLPCPADEAETIQAAVQTFERGYMIWRADTDQIYVMESQSRRLARYPDTWVEGEPVTAEGEDAPPTGLLQPERGFGKVWAENEAVQNMLGWATAEEEGYTMTVQTSDAYNYARTFFTWPLDGRIVYTQENTWGFVQDED